MSATHQRDQLLLDLIGRGESTDDLYETLRVGSLPENKIAGYFDAGSPGAMEAILRDMERRGLVRREVDEWRQGGTPKLERMLFA